MIARKQLTSLALVIMLLQGVVAAADLAEAQLLMRKGEYETARDLAIEAIEEGTWNQRWPRLLIDAQLTLGEYSSALETYEQAMKRFSSSLQLRMQGVEVLRFNDLGERALIEQTQIFELLQSSSSRYSGSENRVTAGRYFASRGEDGRKILELFYDRAVKDDPRFVDAHVAIAELALEKSDYSLAADSIERAAKLDPEDAHVAYLAAQAWQSSDPERATKELARALGLNPRHIPSLLMQADENFDREFYSAADEWLSRVEAINPTHPVMWAYRSVLAHVRGDAEAEAAARLKGLEAWPQNPEVDYVIGRELSQKYRFAEGAEAQRRAIQLSPTYSRANFALAQDLLRLGDDATGWELAEWAQRDDSYNVVAFNLMNLRDRLKKFQVLRRGNLLVRMETREAEIYGNDVLDLLEEAERVLADKYEVSIQAPIVVEIFPNQQDFAIRTFGLPGGAGFLGVCFGRVITANSPASQGEDPSNWKSVLWHEFCHVVTLGKTNNRMPRWLSEGISVYEERLRDATWGQQMTPTFRRMILGGDLVPISKLSGAFLAPKSAMHLQLAYFESSLAVEFMVENYGIDMLKRVLVDLGAGIPINEALQRYTESLDNLDAMFLEYAKRRADDYGSEFDWTTEGLPETKAVDDWQAWLDAYPNNYWGMRGMAESLLATGETDTATAVLESIRDLFGADQFDGDTLMQLAALYRSQENTEAELETLRTLVARSADGFSNMMRLMDLERNLGNWDRVEDVAIRSLEVNPLLVAGHQRLVEAASKQETLAAAKRSLEALAAMDPVDPAALYYQTACAYREAEDIQTAKRFALMALEETPHYREAQRLLLELVDIEATEVESNEVATPDVESIP